MTDHINRMLKLIKLLWEKYPDYRFFQLLYNHTRLGTRTGIGEIADPFHYDDRDIMADLIKVLKNGILEDEDL